MVSTATRQRLAARRLDLPRGLRGRRQIEVGDADVRPLPGESHRARPPDAAAAAGDQRDLALEPSRHVALLPRIVVAPPESLRPPCRVVKSRSMTYDRARCPRSSRCARRRSRSPTRLTAIRDGVARRPAARLPGRCARLRRRGARRSPPPATACSCRTCAATGRHASSIPRRRAWPSRRRSARTCSTSWTRSACRAAALAGYDWGGRAACIAAILAPERVRALVTIGGYNVQNTRDAARRRPRPWHERAYWYQWYFNTERGRLGLEQNRREICRLLWQEWSPTWRFDDATFDRTAPSFDNPDFVAGGDPLLPPPSRQRAGRSALRRDRAAPRHATADHRADHDPARGGGRRSGPPRRSEGELSLFPAGTERRVVPGVGHFMPREEPARHGRRRPAEALLR